MVDATTIALRAVKAQALRDAADALSKTDPVETALSGLWFPVSWLRNRADETEFGEHERSDAGSDA